MRSRTKDSAASVALVVPSWTGGMRVSVNDDGDDDDDDDIVTVKRVGFLPIVSAMLLELMPGMYACWQANAISRSLSSSQRQTACFASSKAAEPVPVVSSFVDRNL
jgi:hypothetical protein